MKIINAIIALFAVSLFLISCESDYVPAHELTNKGGFVRWDTEVGDINFTLDLTKESNPVFEAPIAAPGGNVASYDLSVTLVTSKETVGPFFLKSVTEFPSTLSFSLQDVADAGNLALEEVKGVMNFSAVVTNTDGQSFTTADFTGDLFNPGQRHAMTFSISTICPSDIAGTYSSITTGMSTDGCCPNETTVEGTVTLTETGTGTYTISDWSAGLYLEWYDVYGITPDTDLSGTLVDACGGVSFPGLEEPFGTAVSVSGVINEETGVITYTWTNGFDDQATVTLTPE